MSELEQTTEKLEYESEEESEESQEKESEESQEEECEDDDSEDESLDTRVSNHKVNVMIQDLDKESLMIVMKMISDLKLKHSFQCGIIPYNEMEPHHQFGFGEPYEPGEGAENELTQEMYMITYIRDHDQLPLYMKSFVKDFIRKVKKFDLQYEDVLEEDEFAAIMAKAKSMKYV